MKHSLATSFCSTLTALSVHAQAQTHPSVTKAGTGPYISVASGAAFENRETDDLDTPTTSASGREPRFVSFKFDDRAVEFTAGQGLHVPTGGAYRFFNRSAAEVQLLVASSPTAGDRVNLGESTPLRALTPPPFRPDAALRGGRAGTR